MAFLEWLGSTIAKIVADKVIAQLKEWADQQAKITAIGTEAKGLMGELDNANSDEERKAIMRKIANFSDLKHLL